MTDDKICSRCGKSFDNPDGTTNSVHDTQRCMCYDEPNKEVTTESNGRCYDCLKTPGFSITLVAIIIGTVIATGIALGSFTLPKNTYYVCMFIIFWALAMLLVLLLSWLSYAAINSYCTKGTTDYKSKFIIFIFGTLVLSTVSIIIVIATNIQANYDYWVPIDSHGCYHVADRYTDISCD